MNMLSVYRRRQGGFTLIEIMVVLVLIAVLASLSIFAFRGDRSKGTVLYSKVQQYGTAMARLQMDASCYPTRTGALINQAAAQNSACGLDLRPNWRGPYAKAEGLDANQDILMPEVSPTAVMTIGHNVADTNANGLNNEWYLRVSNVPNDIAAEAVDICNKGAANGPCVAGAPGAGGTTTVDLIFDERP